MAERHLSTPSTLAFQERANAELCTLNSRLNDRLKQDITRIYTDCLFADLDLLFSSGSIRTHRSLLETRVPNFYKELISWEHRNNNLAWSNLSLHLIESFIREVYNRNILKHKEDAVVAQIRILRGEKECDVGSPDSDVFVTPKASPSEPHLIESYHGDSHKVYYSLVHFEEGSQQVLEKELAEQDELSNSFRSIIIKETRQKPLPNVTIKLKNSSKKDVSQKPCRPQQFNTKLKPYVKTKLVLKLQNQLDDMNRVQGIGQKEEDIMSNPDSCLEPVSSGYVTGCSPRDTNSSEALGADTTEVASSEDIPHDDKSRGSSSVSSDPGTWDSTFPTNDEDTFIEKENSENITKSDSIVFFKEKSTITGTLSPGHEENTTLDKQVESAECSEYMYSFSEKNGAFINLKRGTQYSSSLSNQEFSASNTNNFFIDAASLRDENEMYLPNIRNPIFPSTNIMQPKTQNCDEMSLENANDKSDLDVRKVEAFLDKEPKIHSESNSIKEKEEVNHHKLIRRNTFDLDPDDITLTRLKEEYEKSQSDAADTDNSSNVNEKSVSNNYQLHLDKKVALHSPHEEDMHSPDSLNNDFHLDSFSNSNGNCKKTIETLNSISECEKNENVQITKQSENSLENQDIIAVNISSSPIDILKINNLNDHNDLNKTSDSFISDFPSNVNLSSRKTELSKLSESAVDNYFNKIEQTPIVSGGTQFSDLSSSEFSVSASPLARRKNEFVPILSGGFDEIPSVEPDKIKTKVSSSLSTSWVVDMSDSGKSPPESLCDNKIERNRSGHSGMGFFVPLDDHDPYPSFDSFTSNSSAERSDSGQPKKSILSESNASSGFFIDLKEKNDKISYKSEQPGHEKRLFSMFIDIGNSKSSDSTSPKSKPGSPFFPIKRNKGPSVAERLTAKHMDKKSNSASSDSGLDLGEHPEIAKGRLLFNECSEQTQIFSDSSNNDSGFITKRQSFYMFIGNEESPVIRRRTLPSGIKQNTNRHSWNNEYKLTFKSESCGNKKEHKRSSSISYDESYNKERFSSGPSSIEDVMLKQKEKKNGNSVLASWHGPIKPSSELSRIISNGSRLEFKEKAKEIKNPLENSESEFPDKGEDMSCSIKSDDVFDISNATLSSKEDVNRTFVVDDVSKVVNINTNDLELSTPSHDIVSDLSKDDSVTDLVQDQKSTSSNATNKSSVCDIDQNTPKFSEHSSSQPALDSAGGFVKLSDMDKEPAQQQPWKSSVKGSRMSRSIPEGSWVDSKIITNSASSRSLSRLFPHLYSKPESRDSSLQSSLHSSIVEPSPVEVSTEEEGSCTSGGPCSRLGEDLLRMFLDEISPDVTVEVGGRRIKAHKCILSSRCQYFAGMLSGGWVESAGNVISLQGFSYNTVHFALCHIYSGASQIPETINIVELATLADMLCLEGLKEVIMYTLKVKYCHFFHKPCSGCLVGVVECLPLAAAYSLDEIYRKSLRWITKHFVKIWPTKGFASLPKELHEKCYKQHTVHMSNENVLETVMGCDKLEATIPNVRWANPVFALNSKLHEATVKYIGQHFASILASQAFMTLGHEDSWTVTRLEETLLNISKSLSPDQACQSYKRIKIILSEINNSDPEVIDWKLEFLELLTKLETSIEDCLIRQAGRAARTTSWGKMDLALRRRIQEAACLVFTPGPRPVSASREISKSTKVEIKPKSPAPSSGIVRKTVSASSQPPKTTQSPVLKPKTPSKLSQVKSRYLDPKPVRKETPEAQPRRMSGTGKAISSSDSSRTSSPATARVSRPGTAERRTPIAGRRLVAESSEATSQNFKENRASTSKESDPKCGALKRQSTFRVATKSSSAKQVIGTTKQVTRTRTPSNLPTKTSVNNNKIKPSSATARSGTFHRDDTFQNKKVQQSN